MKLIYCINCSDLFRLTLDPKRCICGDSGGYYKENGHNAWVSEKSIVLGIDNGDLVRQLSHYLKTGKGTKLDAFIIADKASTIERGK